jgi:thioredoxin 2
VPASRTAGTARCGTSKQPLFVAAPIGADRAVFERQVGRSSILALVDVSGPVVRSVPPCRMMAPAGIYWFIASAGRACRARHQHLHL